MNILIGISYIIMLWNYYMQIENGGKIYIVF